MQSAAALNSRALFQPTYQLSDTLCEGANILPYLIDPSLDILEAVSDGLLLGVDPANPLATSEYQDSDNDEGGDDCERDQDEFSHGVSQAVPRSCVVRPRIVLADFDRSENRLAGRLHVRPGQLDLAHLRLLLLHGVASISFILRWIRHIRLLLVLW